VCLTVHDLVEALTEKLRVVESGARELDLRLDRVDADPVRETIVLSHPNRTKRHLWSLLRPKVERLNLGFGVERIVLTAPRTGRLRHEQTEQWREGHRADAKMLDRAMGEMVDTLTDRLGPERAVRVAPVESHCPEQAFEREPVLDGRSSKGSGGSVRGSVGGSVGGGAGEVTREMTRSERPSVLFDHPEPVEVMALTRDGAPAWVRWQGFGEVEGAERVGEAAGTRVIVAGIGPERIAEAWWEEPGAKQAGGTRDYFKVQDETGRWLWVYRECASGRWFVHGAWA
jgi:protein ImuB